MKQAKYIIIFFLLSRIINPTFAQITGKITEADKQALEGVIVEKYYVYNSKDKFDTTGGVFPKGAITYRIYIDMKPGYTLQAVFGTRAHKLRLATTTSFFNNVKEGNGTGDKIYSKNLNHNTVAFDSWLTMGACTESHNGVPLTEDTDGSIITNNSFKKADGLKAEKTKPVTYFGIDPSFFHYLNPSSEFSTDNGSWAIFGGMKGATESNKVLIAQLTTEGKLSFELNVQIGTPTGASLQYVAKNAGEKEFLFEGLNYENK